MTKRFFINEQSNKILVLDSNGSVESYNLYDQTPITNTVVGKEIKELHPSAPVRATKIHIHEGNTEAPKSTETIGRVAEKFNKGMSASEIAEDMDLSIGTVYQLKTKAKKLGMLKEKTEPIKRPSQVQDFLRRKELVKAYSESLVSRVEQMYGDGYKVEEISKDIDVELPTVQVQTIIDRLEL